MSDKPLILVTNDDGFEAPGLAVLREAAAEIGEVLLVAPRGQRSAVSQAVSINLELPYKCIRRDGKLWGHALRGMPADCVKLGVTRLAERPVDLVISGINPGANVGNNILYSGTVGAAREAAMLGIPAIALSQQRNIDPRGRQHFESAADFIKEFAPRVLADGLPRGSYLNVNVPNLPTHNIAGACVTRQGQCFYHDEMEPVLENGEPVAFSNVGVVLHPSDNPEEDYDDVALTQRKVSITPLHYDLTLHGMLDTVAGWIDK